MGNSPKSGWQFFVVLVSLAQVFITPRAQSLASAYRLSPASYWAAQDEALKQGLAALKDNRLDEALDRLTAAEHEHPTDARIRNFRGIVFAQLGRSAEAAREYREAIRLDPKLEDAYRNLGFLEWTEHNLEAARAQLKQALDLAPDDAFAHYYLGRAQLDAKLYENAFQELNRSQVAWPADADFLIQAAIGYRALGRLAESRKTLDRLRTMPLRDAQVARVASLLVSIHENDAAIDRLNKVSERQNAASSGWVQFDLALAHLLAANYAKAADLANEILKTQRLVSGSPAETASAWSLLGIANARLNQGQAAVDALRQACRLDPTREEHWLNLTRELMELDQYSDAISTAQEGLASNPRSYALHLRLGAAYLSTDRYSDAEDVFRELVASEDPLPTSYVGLAQVLLRTGRAEDAVSELTAAGQKLGPTFLIGYFRGLALDRAGKPGEAVSAFKDAVRLDPNNSEAHFALGKTELAIGRAKDATAELQESLRLDPGNVQAQRLLSQAYRRTGDAPSASQYAPPSTATQPPNEGELLGDFLLPEWETPPSAQR